jgi:hypothetical protein
MNFFLLLLGDTSAPATRSVCYFSLLLLFAESKPAGYASKLKRLPLSLQEAVESLSADKVLHELIGDKLVTQPL